MRWLLLVAIFIIFPVIFLILEAQKEIQDQIWQHIVDYLLWESLFKTILLVVIVVPFSMILGTTLAWFVAVCEFPGCRFFSWSLLLPFALPTYVMGFSLFDLAQQFHFFGFLKNPVGLSLVMIFSFYPYTYLLTRQLFLKQGRLSLLVCLSLGHSNTSAFFRGVFPLARPAIFISGIFIGLEVFADFGTVSIFNYDTLTIIIYKSWYSFFSLPSAARLSLILLFLALVFLFLEKWFRRKARYDSFAQRSNSSLIITLTPLKKIIVCGFCSIIFFVSFVVPVLKLLIDTFSLSASDWQYLSFGREVVNSFVLSVLGTIFILGLILMVLLNYYSFSFPRKKRIWLEAIHIFLNIGYVLPGTVIAIGIFLTFSFLEKNFFFIGTQGVFMLILAYCIRFWSVGYHPLEKGWLQMNQSMNKVIYSLGNPKRKAIFFVYLPFLKSAIGVSGLFLFLDILKEMPMTLMIRPFGWNTLAVKIYELTSEGLYELASLPALLIILVSLFPVIFIFRYSGGRA